MRQAPMKHLSFAALSAGRDDRCRHPATRLGPGGFAAMGVACRIQFTCARKATCIMMVTFDGR